MGIDAKHKGTGDQIAGQWKQLKGKARQQWGKLTDDDLERVKGHRDELVGVVQERYGKARNEAKKEVDDFFSRHDA